MRRSPRPRQGARGTVAVSARRVAVSGRCDAGWTHPNERLTAMAHDHDHDHGHGGHTDTHTHVDFAEMLPVLEQEAELFTPLYAQAAGWLKELRTDPELIVDAGSGPGVISCLLADTFPTARV